MSSPLDHGGWPAIFEPIYSDIEDGRFLEGRPADPMGVAIRKLENPYKQEQIGNISWRSRLPRGIISERITMMEAAMAGICRAEVGELEEADDRKRIVEEAIRAADGDLRRAICALILGQHEIGAEKVAQVSAGYGRRGLY